MTNLFSRLLSLFDKVPANPTPTVPQAVTTTIPASAEATPNTEEPTMSKLSAYFAVIKLAAGAVLTAEVSAPTGATGADKLDIAKAALESAYPELGIADVAFETIWPMVKPFIDALVAKFKALNAARAAQPQQTAESAAVGAVVA